MKVWTYAEMSTKVLTDLDLLDKAMVTDNELLGYFNEAVLEGESEIITLNQDYFLTMAYLPVVAGTVRYNLPGVIFANRIRTIMYVNGALIYEIRQYRRQNKFIDVALTDFSGQGDDYRYMLVSNYAGQAQLELHPAARETAVLAPIGGQFAPVQVWFLRRAGRIPIIGEYANTEVFATTQVNTGTSTLTTQAGTGVYGISGQGVPGSTPGSIAYVTGDVVRFTAGPNGTLPSPLVALTPYYVIASGNTIKLATSLANALIGTAITLTTAGTVYFTMQVQATTAIQQATLIDIPQFSTFVMQWVKCRIYEKEMDPRLPGAITTLAQQKQQMVDTLVKSIDDDDDKIQMDFSSYNEMS